MKRSISMIISFAMFAVLLAGFQSTAYGAENPYEPTEFVQYGDATFGRATAAYDFVTADSDGNETGTTVCGMPLFNGQEEDFDEYIGLLFSEIGDEGIIALAAGGTANGVYVNDDGEEMVYTIPNGNVVGGKAVMGAADQTAFSTVMYKAQSWDKDLVHQIGYLMTRENKSKQDNGGYNFTSGNTSMTDMRINPLSGRYDEGYGEDSTMASIFADLNARGYNGYPADETGFYILGYVNTKHYSVYNAQWFRPMTNTQVGVRSFYEYNSKSANRGWEDGTFSSFMSAFGRINGVPISSSFITARAASLGPYAVFTGPDAGADEPYIIDETSTETSPSWGNGYDIAYSPDQNYRAASMGISGHRASGGAEALKYAVENGLNGITVEDLKNAAEAYLTIRTRTGIYDEKDADGLSKFYPFNNIAANADGKIDYTSEESQALALRNAQEGIVLLKNANDALPLDITEAVGIYGVFAKAVNSGIYAVGVEDFSGRGEEAGTSPLESIELRDENVSFDLGLNVMTIQNGGNYLYVDPEDTDGIIQIRSEEEFRNTEDKSGYYFGILDNGQGADSIYAYGNGMWLRAVISDPTVGFDGYVGSTSPLMNNAVMEESPFGPGWGTTDKPLVVADDDATFKQRPNPGLPPMLSGYPYHFVMEPAPGDGEYYIRAGAKSNGVTFVTGEAALMDKYNGFYLEAQDYTTANGETYPTLGLGGAAMGDSTCAGIGFDYFDNLEDKGSVTFKFTEVEPYGYAASENLDADDAAVIFVGQSYLGLSGEGTDRLDLNIGKGQIESALSVAKAYKEAGKKTVVVVYADYPVAVQELQDSEDVDAILFAGYGGQFGGKATAQIIFGETAPTGRLVSTWYKGIELFPELDEYSVPVGTLGRGRAYLNFEDGLTLDDIDPRITVDMTAADVINTGLTYKYLSDEELENYVTYPFGYGLGYSTFELSNFEVQGQDGEVLNVSVDVTNTGDVDTSDIVEIYMSKDGSEYKDAVAYKSLAGFERVDLKAGETKTVSVDIDLEDIALWDVNAEKYVVEDGAYVVYAAHDSSLKDALSCEVEIEGEVLAPFTNNEEMNIWEHSYDFENVHFDEYSKLQTAASAAEEGVNDDTFAVTAKTEGAWVAIPKVDLTQAGSITLTAGAPEGVSGDISIRINSPDGEEIGIVHVDSTGEVALPLVANNDEAVREIHEQGYEQVTADVAADGVYDLYLVFGAKDLRAATVTVSDTE